MEGYGRSPSNAACTLLFRLCVASNALAVAAAEGGLLPLIFTLPVPDFDEKSRIREVFTQDK